MYGGLGRMSGGANGVGSQVLHVATQSPTLVYPASEPPSPLTHKARLRVQNAVHGSLGQFAGDTPPLTQSVKTPPSEVSSCALATLKARHATVSTPPTPGVPGAIAAQMVRHVALFGSFGYCAFPPVQVLAMLVQ